MRLTRNPTTNMEQIVELYTLQLFSKILFLGGEAS